MRPPQHYWTAVVHSVHVCASRPAGMLTEMEAGHRRNGQLWWIQSVYVHADYRRRGFFRALYQHVVQQAKEEHAVGIRLYVDAHNTKAQETVSPSLLSDKHQHSFDLRAQAVQRRSMLWSYT